MPVPFVCSRLGLLFGNLAFCFYALGPGGGYRNKKAGKDNDLPSLLEFFRWARGPAVCGALQVAAAALLAFYGLKKCLEVAFAKAIGTLALDDLIEQGGAVFYRFGKQL